VKHDESEPSLDQLFDAMVEAVSTRRQMPGVDDGRALQELLARFGDGRAPGPQAPPPSQARPVHPASPDRHTEPVICDSTVPAPEVAPETPPTNPPPPTP
jgi:hypothetical protein